MVTSSKRKGMSPAPPKFSNKLGNRYNNLNQGTSQQVRNFHDVWHTRAGKYRWSIAEVVGVTFSDSDSAPVPKFWNPGPDPDPEILQIWESGSCSDSGYNHWSNRNVPMFLLKKWPQRLLLLLKWKSDSGSGFVFSQIFDSGSGSERKTQNPAGVDSGTPDPVPPLVHSQV